MRGKEGEVEMRDGGKEAGLMSCTLVPTKRGRYFFQGPLFWLGVESWWEEQRAGQGIEGRRGTAVRKAQQGVSLACLR